MSRILVAGCGDLGTALGRRLAAAGDEVWGLRRDPTALPPEIRPLAADLTRPASLTGLPADLDAVVYTAAAGGFDEQRYRAVYVDGIANLLAALTAREHRPRRILFTSSTAVYGRDDGGWVDESSATAPRHFSGRRLLAGEELLHNAPIAAVVLRLAGLYGPGRSRLIDTVRSGRAECSAGPPLWTNRIHRDDAAAALEHLLRLADPAPVYLGVDREPAERCAVLRWLARRLGAPPPAVGGEPSPRRRSNKRCRSDLLAASGFRFRFPDYRQGYEAVLTGMGL